MNPLANIENIGFVDTETRAEPGASPNDANVTTAGTYRYAKKSFVIVSTWALGSGPVFDICLDEGFDGDWLSLDRLPYQLREFLKRVEQGERWLAAFNAGFDRNALYHGTADLPRFRPENFIDVMAQVLASNLPPSLEGASRSIGRPGKQDDGKKLIQLFCPPDGGTPQSHPAEWERFKSYGRRDTDEMREVWKATRPLPLEEWQDYWVSESINDRGVAIDLPMAERAALIAAADVRRINKQLTRWTNGQITAVTQNARIADWAYDAIEYAEARDRLVKEWNEEASTEDGVEADLKVGKVSIERSRIEAVLAFFNAKSEAEGGLSERDQTIVDVLTARQFGGSSSPQKFTKMLNQHDDGVLKGMYVFNGAQQTGRFSSKGVQTHNLTRSSLGSHEIEAIEMINELEV